jgi:hypothetical protein
MQIEFIIEIKIGQWEGKLCWMLTLSCKDEIGEVHQGSPVDWMRDERTRAKYTR